MTYCIDLSKRTISEIPEGDYKDLGITNLEREMRSVKENELGVTVFFQETSPGEDPKYWKIENNAVVGMPQAEKDHLDATQSYENTKNTIFKGRRYHVYAPLEFIQANAAELKEWVDGRTNDPESTVLGFVDGNGISHTFCDFFAPGHEDAINSLVAASQTAYPDNPELQMYLEDVETLKPEPLV